jgi:E1A/CREB-binding protein
VRTSAKAFTEHGCDKSGIAADWKTYLDQIGKENKLVTYRAHRFNILFYSAAATYYHRNDIFNFLATLPEPNKLLKAVQFDIQQKVYLAQIRALGMVDKIITGPFWRLVEGTASILDLNAPLNHMLQQLKSWAVDATPLFEGEPLFRDVDIHRDELYQELFAESGDVDLDTYTQVALEMILTGIVLILERQAKDQLRGGIFFAPSETLLKSASNVPCTNNVSERDFAILDVLVRMKPAASSHAYETYLMWLNNKPSKWLDSMDVTEKNALLDQARNNYPKIREQYLARKDKLKLQHIKALRTKQQKQETKEQRNRINKVAATDAIMPFGGVWTVDSLQEKLGNIEPAKRKSALVAQLQYHKKVLKSKGSPSLFYKSSHNIEFTEEKLKSNLATVLELNEITTDNVQSMLTYNTKETMTTNVKRSKTEMLAKVAEQRNKLKAKQQLVLLPEYYDNPETLIGKNIKHKCREEDGTVEWFSARVTGIHRLKQNPLQTEFEVIYDDFPDDTWHFPLLSDLKVGDLIIKI